METRASYLLVGSFVLALMLSSVAFVVWMTGGSQAEKTLVYHMRFEGSVTGLQVGSQVRFRGIPVGQVKSIDIIEDETDPKKPISIEVAVEIKENIPLRENTRAVLEAQGITGVSFVQLVAEAEGSDARLAKPTKKQKVYVLTKPSSIEKIFKSFPELLAELTVLTVQAKKLLTDENIERITATLGNIETISANMAKDSDDITALFREGREVLEAATPAIVRFAKSASAIEDAAREIETMIKTNQQPIADFAATGLYDLSQFFVEARQLVQALSRISKKLDKDPARFLFGDPSSRGYKPQ